jgi:hypothetical protein
VICNLFRKPVNGGVLNALPCGGVNIEASRIGTTGETKRSDPNIPFAPGIGRHNGWRIGHKVVSLSLGRYPANLLWVIPGCPEVFCDLRPTT